MNMQIIYTFDPETREFIGAYERDSNIKSQLDISDRTLDAPVHKAGFTTIRNADNTAWLNTADHRGIKQYNTTSKIESTVDYIGDIKDGFTLQTPPHEFCIWSAKNKAWIVDSEGLLADAKLKKRAEINQARDKAELSGFEYGGNMYDSDDAATRRISNAALAARSAIDSGDSYDVYWTLQDNTNVRLLETDLVALQAALVLHVSKTFEKANMLKAMIELAESQDDLNNITW